MGKLEHSSYSVYRKAMTINMAQKFKTFPYFNLSGIFCFTNFKLAQFSRYFNLENCKEKTKSDDVWLCTADMSREFDQSYEKRRTSCQTQRI